MNFISYHDNLILHEHFSYINTCIKQVKHQLLFFLQIEVVFNIRTFLENNLFLLKVYLFLYELNTSELKLVSMMSNSKTDKQ